MKESQAYNAPKQKLRFFVSGMLLGGFEEVLEVFLGDSWGCVWDMFGRFLQGLLLGCWIALGRV